jgi:hypothetical protein
MRVDEAPMQPRFAIDGAGWSVSFQRRVGAANRGAIPCVQLDSPADRMRVLVPLRAGEALWIAILAPPEILADGVAGDRPLRVVNLSPANDGGGLRMLDAVLCSHQWMPIDMTSIACIDDRDAIGDGALKLVLRDQPAATAHQIEIILATPELYGTLSGLPAPRATTEQDEFGGWRLP